MAARMLAYGHRSGGFMKAARVSLVVLPLVLTGSLAAQTARPATAAAPVARALTPADTVAMRAIGDFAAAPDGTSVLFTVLRSTAQTNRLDTILMLLRRGQSAPVELRLPATSMNSIRWAPDSKHFAFFATDPGAGQMSVYV